MGKQPSHKSGNSKIRLIVFEADIAEGEIGQIAQALQNALRPPSLPTPKVIASPTSAPIIDGTVKDAVEEEYPEAEEADEDFTPPAKNKPARQPRNRSITSPEVVDIDTQAEKSLEDFLGGYRPTTESERYLLISTWLKEHRSIESVTQSHIYTCYRAMRWPTEIKDWGGTLRSLKFRKLYKSVGKGEYAINHLGVGEALRALNIQG